MTNNNSISRRGVYYDLTKSPYEFKSPYGDIFKFRSQKKLDIYTRDIVKELERIDKLIDRHQMRDFLPDEIVQLLYRKMYQSFYHSIEG